MFKNQIAKMFKNVSRSTERKVHELQNGIEVPDPEPAFVPTGLAKQESIQQMIRRMIRTEASLHADSLGQETFEEADDFDIGDDDEFESAYVYEENFDPLPDPITSQPEQSSSEGETETATSPATPGSSEA